MPYRARTAAWTGPLAHLAAPFLAAGTCWTVAQALLWLTGGMG